MIEFNRKMLELYAITDRSCIGNRDFETAIEDALKGGATIIQLREKELYFDAFCNEAVKIREICHRYNAPLIINDNVEVALKANADGVHLGQSDMSISKAREILGKDKIIGGSARTTELAILAEKSGADYIGCGAVFGTTTKSDAKYIGTEVLKSICKSVSIPVVAIGGINADNATELKGCGISGIAVVSSIFGADNICKAAEKLRKITEKII